MKFARYEAHGEVAYGVVEDDLVKQLTTSPFEDYEITDHAHPLSDVKLLAPCMPGKIIAIGLNYKSHLWRQGAAQGARAVHQDALGGHWPR